MSKILREDSNYIISEGDDGSIQLLLPVTMLSEQTAPFALTQYARAGEISNSSGQWTSVIKTPFALNNSESEIVYEGKNKEEAIESLWKYRRYYQL